VLGGGGFYILIDFNIEFLAVWDLFFDTNLWSFYDA
jgi:hypothetical protein